MSQRLACRHGTIVLTCASILAVLSPLAAHAQLTPVSAASSAATKSATATKSNPGPAWSELKPAEQAALKPLQSDWASIDDLRKRTWLQMVARYPLMNTADQILLQARMAEWAKMTSQERSKVRSQFLDLSKIPSTDRQERWEAYQALSLDERKALAARAASAPRAAGKASEPGSRTAATRLGARQAKANAVPAAASAPSAKPATPTVVQGAPGATTVLITKHQARPAHPAKGGAKIIVSPDVVDKSTLLPRAGAQSPRARPAAASTPASRP